MKARKRFGQHFLEHAWVVKVVDAFAPGPDDVVLEIGPGRGALTMMLAPRVKRLIAVEIDRDLVAALEVTAPPNVQVISGDFLDVNLPDVLASESAPVRVVGNLPYNVSSPILFKLLSQNSGKSADAGSRSGKPTDAGSRPSGKPADAGSRSAGGRLFSDATLMLQREVADRLVANPGTSDYGVLAIQTAVHADVDRLLTLPPGAFRPPPKVTSAVVRLRFHEPSVSDADLPAFERMVRAVFTQRRKTLLNALKPVTGRTAEDLHQILDSEGIDAGRRPETLTVPEFARLARRV